MVIPAISELIDTWTGVFGFRPLEGSQVEEIKSISMLVFPHTGLLEKQLLKKDSTGKCEPAEEGKDVESHLSVFLLIIFVKKRV